MAAYMEKVIKRLGAANVPITHISPRTQISRSIAEFPSTPVPRPENEPAQEDTTGEEE